MCSRGIRDDVHPHARLCLAVSRRQVPIARQALAHESRDIRLIGMRLTNLVSTTPGARQAAIRFRLLERISVRDYDNDEGELYTTL